AGPGLQDSESLMRLGSAVQVEPMTVETPGQCRICGKPMRIRQGSKAEAELLVGRVGPPKSLVSAEVRQAGIDAHAGVCRNQESIGRCHGSRRLLNLGFIEHHSLAISKQRDRRIRL